MNPAGTMQHPLKSASHLGSAHDGAAHWWQQRLTAIALLPLTLWLLTALPVIAAGGYRASVEWLAAPWNAVFAVLTTMLMIHHAVLGLQVVIEDYVGRRALAMVLLIALRLAGWLAAAAGVVFIALIVLGTKS